MPLNTKTNIAIKGLIIAGLILVLLIPAFMIKNLVNERQQRQEEAFHEISSKWAEAQTITGPVISIPYLEFYKDSLKNIHSTRRYVHILPDKLLAEGNLLPEKRYRGIFEVVVYTSQLSLKGRFSGLISQIPSIPKENILFDQAFVSVGISDLRGIKEQLSLHWNQENYSFNPGVETNDIIRSGINTHVRIQPKDSGSNVYDFSFDITLKGSQYLYFVPVGKETIVKMSAPWTAPSFDGAFLPEKREISEKGFLAEWKVLHLNRNYPQHWLNSDYSVDGSAFGVNLILPMDNYIKTDRSIKYAILFIALTFLIFFFLELLNYKFIHPLQYILIGFALCIFYLLLLSISEHISFNLSYLIAALMTIGLITWYSRSILADKKLSFLVGGNLVILYGFIFTIIQLEDYALLMGGLGLFIILTVVMYYSRKIDWNGLANRTP